ncbi:cysteine desulfurase DndA [Micromonospora profundi]|uniref:cysteine desulfurase DndA n=1 Tax=Micromonospora profundi TaxID=1420889 RepID=UPI002FF3E761
MYLDCAATTPLDPRVAEEVSRYLLSDFGNAGSRTHAFGQAAKTRVQAAREQVAAVVAARADEVIFTSGATESNNIALLGLADHAERVGRRHIISTAIEHKAVLEPLAALASRGFEVTLLDADESGRVDLDQLRTALRPETVLVSMMHANNETGVLQPLTEAIDALADHDAYLHVDAAQTFGKELDPLRLHRIDLISISGHKIFAPKGVGALVMRRRRFARPPLKALQHGGGQERGLRPGTLPVALIAGLGTAASLAVSDHQRRRQACEQFRAKLWHLLTKHDSEINGDSSHSLISTLNASIPGKAGGYLDSEAVMVALKPYLAISNGSACTSTNYTPSHVLQAMGLPAERIQGALRFSWCHLTPEPDWAGIGAALSGLRG